MLRLILVRPGATDFDEQGRIKGALDIPLNAHGQNQVAQTVDELVQLNLDRIYTAPCQSAQQTAQALAKGRNVKIKEVEAFANLDHGLWQGKLIKEVKQKQPKVYKKWQEHPELVCPPEGETIEAAKQRVNTALMKMIKKHKSGVVALVVPEPLASLLNCFLSSKDIGDLWASECDSGKWESIDIEPEKLVPA